LVYFIELNFKKTARFETTIFASQVDFSDAQFTSIIFNKTKFEIAIFSKAQFGVAVFTNVRFKWANFSRAKSADLIYFENDTVKAARFLL
jgi:uncharacterized protein YjbI with pentapeptide repeats